MSYLNGYRVEKRASFQIEPRKLLFLDWQFVGSWVLFFLILVFSLYAAGAMPQGAEEIIGRVVAPFYERLHALANPADSQESTAALLPTRGARPSGGPQVIASGIALNAPVLFPRSTDLDTLNNALSVGVVHYPGSALPGERGNVFLFGHSTGLAVVHNQAYASFNRIQELDAGDIIRLRFGSREYWYRVSSISVKKADAALVDFSPTEKRLLTLSTCRIFGATDDRFVVEAEFVQSYPLRGVASAAGTSS